MDETPPTIRMTAIQRRLVEVSAVLRDGPSDETAYLHSVLCQAALPLKNPGDGVTEWERRQGAALLQVQAGYVVDPKTRQYVRVGLPHSEKARLILIHLISEAIVNQSPEIEVAGSITRFVQQLKLPSSGRPIRTVRDQLTRLSAATIRMAFVRPDGSADQTQGPLIESLQLWAPSHPGQRVLWPGRITLSDAFYQSVRRHAVPLEPDALQALSHSALALDVYCWLAQRLHRLPTLPNDAPHLLPWAAVCDQFAGAYNEPRYAKPKLLHALKRVLEVYPQARVKVGQAGLLMRASPPPKPLTGGQRLSWG